MQKYSTETILSNLKIKALNEMQLAGAETGGEGCDLRVLWRVQPGARTQIETLDRLGECRSRRGEQQGRNDLQRIERPARVHSQMRRHGH